MNLRAATITVLAALFFCSGCSTYQPTLLAPPSDPVQYAKDVAFCQAGADSYKPSLSLPDIATGAASGAANNATGAAINPLVPVLGAAGGAGSALANGLDVMGSARGNVLKHCLLELTHRDRSAVIADPN